MKGMIRAWGYDPGGNERHGVADLVYSGGALCLLNVGSVDSSQAAVDWFMAQPGGRPDAFGVDTLTALSGGKSGWRPADEFLRAAYPGSSQSVCSPNGLYGAMCLNGLFVLSGIRSSWPELPATEAHPKLAWAELCGDLSYPREPADGSWQESWATACERVGADVQIDAEIASEHAFDACMSALAAIQMARRVWNFDLHADLKAVPSAGLWHPAGLTRFVWPDQARARKPLMLLPVCPTCGGRSHQQ